MKKILSVLLVFAALAALADDSYLYWMIGDTSPYGEGSYDNVRVAATDNSGVVSYLNLYGPSGDSLDATTVSYGAITELKNDGQSLYAQLASNKTYSSFVVELLNDDAFVAQSETLTYSQAMADYYITTSNSMKLAASWAPTSFAVPEPNSAMLLLIGCAALGLRRRRQREV